MAEATKKVHFFEIRIHEAGSRSRTTPQGWAAALAHHLAIDVTERAIELPSGVQLVAASVPDREAQACLGRVLGGNTGIQQGSWTRGSFRPVEPESQDDFFTRVTYVQFIEGANAVALVGGAGENPSKTSVERFINKVHPLQKGQEWVLEPITQAAQVERARSRRGLRKVSFRTRVEPAGLLQFSEDDLAEPESIDQALSMLANSAEGPLKITVSITVERPGDHPRALENLKRMIFGSPALLGSSKRLTVEADDLMGTEILNLVEHQLTSSVPLPEGEVTGTAFQAAVLDALNSVCLHHQTAIQGIINVTM